MADIQATIENEVIHINFDETVLENKFTTEKIETKFVNESLGIEFVIEEIHVQMENIPQTKWGEIIGNIENQIDLKNFIENNSGSSFLKFTYRDMDGDEFWYWAGTDGKGIQHIIRYELHNGLVGKRAIGDWDDRLTLTYT